MKRIIIAITLAAAFAASVFTADAKPRAVGVGFGAYQNVSLQHIIYGTDRFFQLDLGYHVGIRQPGMTATQAAGSLKLIALYNIPVYKPEWTSKGNWLVYAGPGAALSTGFNTQKAITLGVAAQVGLEYVFEFPLQLAIDLRPTFGLKVSDDNFAFDTDGLLGFIPTISARYWF